MESIKIGKKKKKKKQFVINSYTAGGEGGTGVKLALTPSQISQATAETLPPFLPDFGLSLLLRLY